MNPPSQQPPRQLRFPPTFASLRLGARALLLIATITAVHADPAWWTAPATRIIEPGTPENNYGPANVGQLKHTANQAHKYLTLQLGPAPSNFPANTPFPPNQLETNYAPINLGQLKAVAEPLYQRILAAGYDARQNLIDHGYPPTWSFNRPWDPGTPVDVNYAPANHRAVEAGV